jgi:hypothetical protein
MSTHAQLKCNTSETNTVARGQQMPRTPGQSGVWGGRSKRAGTDHRLLREAGVVALGDVDRQDRRRAVVEHIACETSPCLHRHSHSHNRGEREQDPPRVSTAGAATPLSVLLCGGGWRGTWLTAIASLFETIARSVSEILSSRIPRYLPSHTIMQSAVFFVFCLDNHDHGSSLLCVCVDNHDHGTGIPN